MVAWACEVKEVQHKEAQRLTVVFRDGGAGGGSPSRGKPEGVRACELWVKVGQPALAKDADWIFQ